MSGSTLHPTALRPWQPLTDDEFAALKPYLPAEGGRGKPSDKRRVLNAVFWIAASKEPWRALPSHMGRGESVARTLRRWARAGILDRLLMAVSEHPLSTDNPHLRRLAWLICRAFRRMARVLDEASVRLAETLGLRAAWPVAVFRWPFETTLRVMGEVLAARAAAEALGLARNTAHPEEASRFYRLCERVRRYALGNRRDWRLR